MNILVIIFSCFLQVVNNADATFVRQITRVSSDQQKVDSYVQIHPLKASICVKYLKIIYHKRSPNNFLELCKQGKRSDTTMELGSDVDDPCLLTSQTGSEIPILPSVCAEVSLVVSDL